MTHSNTFVQQIVQNILNLKSRLYGIRPINFRKLAFQIAEINKIPTRFNTEKKLAAEKWLRSFLTRHPELSLRTPQPTSLGRACGFNKSQVTHFYKLLGDLLAGNSLQPTRIFSMDESGLQ